MNIQSNYLSKQLEIPALTGLRFFAALFVCVAHVVPYVVPGCYSFFPELASEGMTLFFVLSGFVIHYNYSVSIRNYPTIGIYNFFISRFARLYPLFFLCLCLDCTKNFGYSSLAVHFREAIPYYLTLTQSWFYIPMGANALIYQFGLMPCVSWSVSTEWFFYLVYPLICFALIKAVKMRSKFLLFSIICFFTFSIIAILSFLETSINQHAVKVFGQIANLNTHFQDSFFRWLIYFSPYSRVSEFLIGCLTAAIYMQVSAYKTTQKEERFGFIMLVLAILSVIILHHIIFNPPASLYWLINLHHCFGFAPSLALIIFCCARYTNSIVSFVSNPVMLLGGEISYSMYLLHLPIGEAFSRDAAPITSWDVALADTSRFLIAFAAIFGAAMVSYRVIEMPARKVLRKWLMLRPIQSADETAIINQVI